MLLAPHLPPPSLRSNAASLRAGILAALLALSAAAPVEAAANALPQALLTKLDPALLPVALGADSATVWVSFLGKNPNGPGAEAESLAGCWARLTPRARARRVRAHVWPRVDARDLPVVADYLDALRAAGCAPFAVSRWLNRAAVRTDGAGLARVAEMPFVAGLAPVRITLGLGDRPVGPEVVSPGGTRSSPPAPWGTRLGAPQPSALAPVASSQSGVAFKQLDQIRATRLHDAGFTGAGVLIVVLDEGFNFTDKHEALRDRIFPPGFKRDFVQGDTIVSDTTIGTLFDHGTWTLGCVGGYRPGAYLGSGYGADIALGRTEQDGVERPVEMLYWAQGAEWADSLGADIISSSVGYSRFDDSSQNLPASAFDGHTNDITRAAEIAASKGILVVNAVGNGRGQVPEMVAPADMDGDSLIAVGAVDSLGNTALFSSRGPTADGRIKPDLVARGTRAWIVSATGAPNSYTQGDGTSFATPLVAGLAACLMQARPALSPVEIVRALRETASGLFTPNNERGYGIPDGSAALGWTPGAVLDEPLPSGALQIGLEGPNPFDPARQLLRVRFGAGPRLKQTDRSRVRVFDARGRLVRNLFFGPLCCGQWHLADWDGLDFEGRSAPSGVYFVHFDAAGWKSTLRVVLLR